MVRAPAFGAIAPYAAWMMLMMLWRDSALGYAVRSVLSLGLLAYSCRFFRGDYRFGWAPLTAGLAAGLAVLLLWVGPEAWSWYCEYCILGEATAAASPYDPAVCGWPLTLLRLAGSALVIAWAEELFFRHYLYRRLIAVEWQSATANRFDWSALCWSVGLFALEHNRPVAAIFAGVVYTLVYLRRGLLSAVLAHALTNLLLGVWVLKTGAWGLW